MWCPALRNNTGMAVIHHVGMTPTKLDVLAAWLPSRPWYAGTGQPVLARVGGFRLDDPEGEVGIEFMVVRDDAGGEGATYHVPMTYRGAPLASAEQALIGNAEHGVLGKRWIYDGVHDPVLVGQLAALIRGAAEPQHQSESDTPEPRVRVDTTDADALPTGEVESITAADGTVIRLVRVLAIDSSPEVPTLLANFEATNGHGTLTMSGLDFNVRG